MSPASGYEPASEVFLPSFIARAGPAARSPSGQEGYRLDFDKKAFERQSGNLH
jgi:hypothetical protein